MSNNCIYKFYNYIILLYICIVAYSFLEHMFLSIISSSINLSYKQADISFNIICYIEERTGAILWI